MSQIVYYLRIVMKYNCSHFCPDRREIWAYLSGPHVHKIHKYLQLVVSFLEFPRVSNL